VNDRPTVVELLEAVESFLRDDVLNALDGHLKFQARVAANVVGIVARELACEDRHLVGEWQRLAALFEDPSPPPADREALRGAMREKTEELVERIRAGDADRGPWRDAVVAHLKQTVADKLEVAKPPRAAGG
jgi:hypothetical protein